MPSTWPKDVTQYRICNPIGKGGSAVVFKAQTKDGRWVALKRMSLAKIKKHLNLVKKEYKMQKELDHPNILKLHTRFKDASGNLYFVLELAETDLDKHLKVKKPSEVQARRWFRQIVDAMIYLHSKNVYHRDMKLANVLLDSDGVIKIADFGLCVKLEDCDDLRNTFCGTPKFMAPELAEKNSHGLKSEVWSLGVILLKMLTDTNPFTSPKKDTTLKKISEMDEQQLSQHYDHLNKDARDLLGALLQKERESRPSITEVKCFPWLYIKPLVTKYIHPIRKQTKKGSGVVEVLSDQSVVYTKGTFRMKVSSSGQVVNLSEDNKQSEHDLLDLPPVHNGTYKFLSDFCEGIRSRTRIIELNDYINDVSLAIMANNSVKVVRKEKTILTFRRGEFVTGFARYKQVERTENDSLPPFPLELGNKPGFRVVHSMWDAVKNEVVAPEEAPLSLEWDNSSGTTSHAVASSPPVGIGASNCDVSTPSTPFPTSNSLQLKTPRDEKSRSQPTVSQNQPPPSVLVKSICTTLISTTVPVADPATSNQSSETSTACSQKGTAKSHPQLSQHKAPASSTWTIATQTPVMVLPTEPGETAITYLTTSQAFLPSERQTNLEQKADVECGQPETPSCPAIPQPRPKCSEESPMENCVPSPALQTRVLLGKEDAKVENDKVLEHVSGTSAESKDHGLLKDLQDCSTNEPNLNRAVISEDTRSSNLLPSNSIEPISCAPVLGSRLPSTSSPSTVQPSNPPAVNPSIEASSRSAQDMPDGNSKMFKRVFTHNGAEVTFWPSTGIFREIHAHAKTTKWMIPKPYAVWLETAECITVDTENGRFSWDPRQISDPDLDFPYWKELRHILDTISRMMLD